MKRNSAYLILKILLLVGILSSGVLINGCNNSSNDKDLNRYKLTGNVEVDGKNLVQINCTRCHELVPVDALTKNVWKYHTLPSMAHRLKIATYFDNYYKPDKDTGGVSLQEWQTIVAYYQKMAPDTLLPAKKPVPLLNDWA